MKIVLTGSTVVKRAAVKRAAVSKIQAPVKRGTIVKIMCA